MKNDRHYKNELPAYLSGGLTEAQRKEVGAHLAACDICRAQLDRVRARQEQFKRDASKQNLPPRVPNLFLARLGRQAGLGRPERPPLGVMIGAICALGLAAYVIGKRQFSPMRQVVSHPVVPVSGTPPEIPHPSAAPSSKLTVPGVPPPPPAPRPARPGRIVPHHSEFRGSYSGVKKTKEVVIQDADEWTKWWRRMGREGAAPPIAFNSVMIVGVFVGERPSRGYTVNFGPIRETAYEITLPYTITVPTAAEARKAEPTHAYRLILLPRSDKKIVFQH